MINLQELAENYASSVKLLEMTDEHIYCGEDALSPSANYESFIKGFLIKLMLADGELAENELMLLKLVGLHDLLIDLHIKLYNSMSDFIYEKIMVDRLNQHFTYIREIESNYALRRFLNDDLVALIMKSPFLFAKALGTLMILSDGVVGSEERVLYNRYIDLIVGVYRQQGYANVVAEHQSSEQSQENVIELASQSQKASSEPSAPPVPLERLLRDLEALIGLQGVKNEILNLINFVKIRQLRQEQNLPLTPLSLHLVFVGNPGTGKTTVARLVAQLYYSMGLLPSGAFVEAERSELVAGYVGQTAIKTKDVLNKALGGVLFIDEAYTLVKEGSDYGQESIDTILKFMEDYRDKISIIIAGYPREMDRFINSNPGLKSRFNRVVFFDDYSADELASIFEKIVADSGYILDYEARRHLSLLVCDMQVKRGADFGNGRDVRNVFERAVLMQSNRLSRQQSPDKKELSTLTKSDLDAAYGLLSPSEGSPISPTLLSPGGNTNLPSGTLTIQITHGTFHNVELDVSAFLLTSGGKVRGDGDMCFYGQREVSNGGLKMLDAAQNCVTFVLEFSRLDPLIEKVAFSASIYENKATVSSLSHLRLDILNSASLSISAVVDTNEREESALILGEFYRRNGVWKFRFISQGFVGGLHSIAGHFGVDVV
jgi:stress response protein SCP2/SpoVK/Ycf46/Vps4 family AAA+-type ATPase